MEIAVVVAIITGIAQAFKIAFKIPSRFVPLLSIALGIFIVALGDITVQDIIITGIIAGLSASGLYDLGKKTVLNK